MSHEFRESEMCPCDRCGDAFPGSEDDILCEFRRVRDEIGQRLEEFVKENRQ